MKKQEEELRRIPENWIVQTVMNLQVHALVIIVGLIFAKMIGVISIMNRTKQEEELREYEVVKTWLNALYVVKCQAINIIPAYMIG